MFCDDCPPDKRAILAFHGLWNSINEKRGHGWDKNDWVWVVEFEGDTTLDNDSDARLQFSHELKGHRYGQSRN